MTKQQIIVKPKPTNTVRKAEALLRARYSLSELAIKLITTIIAMISKDDADFKLYVIKVQDFKELMNSNNKIGGSAYKQLKDACDELLNRKIEFDDGSEVGFMLTRWIASAEYFAGTGEIELEISQKLRPLLLQLKEGNYLNYELKNILPLKSAYVIRLYEMLKHEYNKVLKYKPNTTAVVHEVVIEDLRKEWGIPDSYQYSSGIKLRIFDKAIEQFEQHTDIKITYKESRKIGKKVLAIEFTIRENNRLADFLRDERAFITYIRKNFVNQDIFKGQGMILSVDKSGRIYDKSTLREYNHKDAKKAWGIWYEAAKEDKLLILKQGTLF